MKRNYFYTVVALLSFLLAGMQPALGQDDPPPEEPALDQPQMPPEWPRGPQIPGRVEGTGTHFEVTDSEYFNITLDSSEPVNLILESIPQMIVIVMEAAQGATSTQITLSGFPASMTLYKYEDDYHNGVAFTTDENGGYGYAQDLSEPHVVFIQPEPGTRYIPTDTEIGTWDDVNKIYTLITDVDELIQINEDNLTLDGAGHTVRSVHLSRKTGVTVKNLILEGYGIYLFHSSGCTIAGNTVNSSYGSGIVLGGSSYCSITDNTTNWNGYDGIRLDYGMAGYTSHHCTLTGNTANSNRYNGITLNRGGVNTLRNNSMSGNRYNFCLIAEPGDWDHSQDIDTSNLVDGRPIYYLTNEVNQVFDSSTDAGAFYLVKCDGITIKDLALANNGSGVRLYNTQNSTIENVTVSNCWGGIELLASTDNTVVGSSASNCRYGMYIRDSSGSTLTGNTASTNETGIYLRGCSSSTLTDNTVSSNSRNGFSMGSCTASTLTGNIALANGESGMRLSGCYDNTLTGNTASNNGEGSWPDSGIWLENSSVSNLHNNIADSNRARGIFLDSSSTTTMTGNSMSGNVYNFGLFSWEDTHNIDTSNTVDGKPIYYLKNVSNTVYDASSNAGTIYCINCQGITIRDLTLTNNYAGVYLWQTQDSTVQNVTAASNRVGLYLSRTHNSTIENVTARNNSYGMQLRSSCGNTFPRTGPRTTIWELRCTSRATITP